MERFPCDVHGRGLRTAESMVQDEPQLRRLCSRCSTTLQLSQARQGRQQRGHPYVNRRARPGGAVLRHLWLDPALAQAPACAAIRHLSPRGSAIRHRHRRAVCRGRVPRSAVMNNALTAHVPLTLHPLRSASAGEFRRTGNALPLDTSDVNPGSAMGGQRGQNPGKQFSCQS